MVGVEMKNRLGVKIGILAFLLMFNAMMVQLSKERKIVNYTKTYISSSGHYCNAKYCSLDGPSIITLKNDFLEEEVHTLKNGGFSDEEYTYKNDSLAEGGEIEVYSEEFIAYGENYTMNEDGSAKLSQVCKYSECYESLIGKYVNLWTYYNEDGTLSNSSRILPEQNELAYVTNATEQGLTYKLVQLPMRYILYSSTIERENDEIIFDSVCDYPSCYQQLTGKYVKVVNYLSEEDANANNYEYLSSVGYITSANQDGLSYKILNPEIKYLAYGNTYQMDGIIKYSDSYSNLIGKYIDFNNGYDSLNDEITTPEYGGIGYVVSASANEIQYKIYYPPLGYFAYGDSFDKEEDSASFENVCKYSECYEILNKKYIKTDVQESKELALRYAKNFLIKSFECGSGIMEYSSLGYVLSATEHEIKYAEMDLSCNFPFIPETETKSDSLFPPQKSCQEDNGKFYDSDGKIVTEKEYLDSCGLVSNPETGAFLSFGIILLMGFFAFFIIRTIKKKNRYKI